MVASMRTGLAKINEKVRNSWYFETPEADHSLAENACYMNYPNVWSPKRVHWLSNSQCPHCSTSAYGIEDPLELYTGVARVRLPLTGIHTWVASNPKIQRMPAASHNSWWIDNCQVYYGEIEAIPILDHLDIEEVYSHIASRHHSVKWHVWSHGWHDMSFGQ
jgi:hypothetical protein